MSGPDNGTIDELASWPLPEPPVVSKSLERELASLRPVSSRRPLRQFAVLSGVSLVYAGCILAVLTTRKDIHELPTGWLVASAIARLFGFLVPCYVALVPRPGTMTHRWQLAAIAVTVASIGFVLFGLAIHPMGPTSLEYGWERFHRGHPCLEIGLAVALVPVIVTAIFLRGAVPVGSRWILAAAGAGGGCLGGLVLHFYCRIADGPHIGLIHGGVIAVAALASAAIARRVTAGR